MLVIVNIFWENNKISLNINTICGGMTRSI